MAENIRRVLIAEDEKPMAKALQMKLTKVGYEVTLAADGEEAIAALKSNDFDIVLLDLIMPKLDGFGVLEEMKKLGNKTPVLVSTNLSQPEDEKRVIELGAKGFFVKSDTPITKVVDHIKSALD